MTMDLDEQDPSSKAAYLPDILAPDLDVIFVGAAASHNSARAGHWYAGPTNKFWLLLSQSGFTPRKLRPEEDGDVLQFGLGLTCIFPHLATSANHLLPTPTADRRRALHEKLLRFQPRFLCFNGKDVYQMSTGRLCTDWGEQEERIGVSRVFVVHSSSARADHWGAERLALYHELQSLVRATGSTPPRPSVR
jgi:TDG/mug DNA glycosylase family protein